MSFRHRAIAGVFAVAFGALAAVPAAPLVAAAPEQRIAVKTCSPTRNVTRAPIAPLGYAPGYYPLGGYYWDDPFGYPYYQPRVAVNEAASLRIDYVNVTDQTMETIVFGLVANGKLVAEVRDVGTFSPNVEIKHEFGLSPSVFPLQTALPQCIPLQITYKDQATWVNPHLRALKRAIYQSP